MKFWGKLQIHPTVTSRHEDTWKVFMAVIKEILISCNWRVAVVVFVTQLCLTLCNPMDCSLPGSSVHGILQVRIVQGVAIPFSRGSSWPRDQTQVSYTAGRFFTIWATREGFCWKSRPESDGKSSVTYGTSLVAQWLGICLPMQGTQIWRSHIAEEQLSLYAAATEHGKGNASACW